MKHQCDIDPIVRQLEYANPEPDYAHTECPSPMDFALANLMISCNQGRFPKFIRGERRPNSRHNSSIQWQDEKGAHRSFFTDADTGVFDAHNPPVSGPYIKDCSPNIDKMLEAICRGYEIAAFCPEPGTAVISWDRCSHGNHPALVLHYATRTLLDYYEAPAEYATGKEPAIT